tara:strand:+ start:138 stop:1037 length:900 start_codon:yes stop_codon:yes gene_type:complete
VPEPSPEPSPKRGKESSPPWKRKTISKPRKVKTTTKEPSFKYIPDFLIRKPTEQIHIFDLLFVDINGNTLSGVEFEADIELLDSKERKKLLENKTINEISDNSGVIHFEITHPIIQSTSGFSTHTSISFTAFKDDYLDISGSFDLQHSEQTLTKEYQIEKSLIETIIILKPKDFINNSFELYSDYAKIEYDHVKNCIETFAQFPATYGELKIGSVTIVKHRNEFYLEFGFNSSVDNDWLLETYKSIGRRMGYSLFDSEISGVRLRINQATTYTTSKDSLSKYLDHEYSDKKFLKKIKKG